MNWNAISTIGVWFSGFATFFAVIVAFRSLNLATNHKLRIDCDFPAPAFGPYFVITIANKGTREVQIRKIGLMDINNNYITEPVCQYIDIKPGFSEEKTLKEFGTLKDGIIPKLIRDQTPPYFYKIAVLDSLGKTHVGQFSFHIENQN